MTKPKKPSQNNLICFMLLVGLNVSLAQTIDSTRVIVQDGFIEKTNNKISIENSLNTDFENFQVITDDNEYFIQPNAEVNYKLKLNYRFISLSYNFSPQFLPGNDDDKIKGKTKSFGLGTSLIFNDFFVDLSYSKVKGYYLHNTKDFIDWEEGDPYIQFPKLHYKGYVFKTGYIHNSKFSLKHIITQTERQLKSTGSFIPVLDLRYYTIDDKSSDLNTQKSKNFESSVGPGYAYTFVHDEKFYFSLGMLTSVGYMNTELTTRLPTGNLKTNQDNFIFKWDAKAGFGFNGTKFYSGIYANLSGLNYNQENTTVRNVDSRAYYHFFIGFRLKAPEYLNNTINKLENLVPVI